MFVNSILSLQRYFQLLFTSKERKVYENFAVSVYRGIESRSVTRARVSASKSTFLAAVERPPVSLIIIV